MKFSIFLTIYFLNSARSDQVVLLDTTKEATLEWTRYPYGPQTLTPGVRTFYNFVYILNYKIVIISSGLKNLSPILVGASTGAVMSYVM